MVFAISVDLGKRLNREFSDAEAVWVDTLLTDATAYLQGEIGQLVHPVQTVTFMGWPSAGWVDLPQWPVVSVGAVERGGEPVQYQLRPGSIRVSGDDPVDVTFTFGYSDAPLELVSLACALVSQQMMLVEAQLGLSIGGLSSVALDDFKIGFADGGQGTGLTLPKVTLDGLRRKYGRGDIVQIDTVT